MKSTIGQILKQYWGYDSFRALQEDIIISVMEGRDTLALLPTGGGKSICFQVPALAMDGICVVVSPLIALMKDQVENLKARGVRAIAITSGLRKREVDILLDNCVYGDVKFLYVSPERLKQPLFIERFKRMRVNLIAVDEAHCISQWGYDFRPPYLEIAKLKAYHPKVPVLALTATATKEVVEDIQEKLEFREGKVFKKSFYRFNLQYVVLNEEDTLGALLRVIKRVNGSGIVYVRTRRLTQEIAQVLIAQQISATFYHAGLSIEEREKKQRDWQSNKVRIMVSTNAFGMGIDKPDVRFVVNIGVPDSLEAYFQEAGRAGRDEKRAYAVLLVKGSDREAVYNRVEMQYPSKEMIKKVYYAVCNYLRIAIGAGLEVQSPIDYEEVAKSFNLKPATVYYALPFLESSGYFSITEPFGSVSTLQFLLQGRDLYEFQVRHKRFDAFIKLILRSYSGLFENKVKIKEFAIATRAKLPMKVVKKMLLELNNLGVVEYVPKSSFPILTFLQPRVEQKYLRIPKSIYEDRKKIALKKVEYAIRYSFSEDTCRNILLLNYFDDDTAQPCGKCDVCLANKKEVELSEEVFLELEQLILKTIKQEHVSPRELVEKLSSSNAKEEVLFVLRWLINNEQLKVDELNKLSQF